MFSFFQKHAKSAFGEMLKVDVNAHLIPGGANSSTDLETSVKYIEKLKSLGYQKIIITSHDINEHYGNSIRVIRERFWELKKELQSRNISISIEAAMDYHLDTEFEILLGSSDILSFGINKYVLLTSSYINPPPFNLEEIIFSLQMRGYQPILCQPERYNYWHTRNRLYKHIREMDCLILVNLLSILGYYGRATKGVALNLIEKGLVDFLGTGLYHDKHLQILYNSAKDLELYRLIKMYNFKNSSLL